MAQNKFEFERFAPIDACLRTRIILNYPIDVENSIVQSVPEEYRQEFKFKQFRKLNSGYFSKAYSGTLFDRARVDTLISGRSPNIEKILSLTARLGKLADAIGYTPIEKQKHPESYITHFFESPDQVVEAGNLTSLVTLDRFIIQEKEIPKNNLEEKGMKRYEIEVMQTHVNVYKEHAGRIFEHALGDLFK